MKALGLRVGLQEKTPPGPSIASPDAMADGTPGKTPKFPHKDCSKRTIYQQGEQKPNLGLTGREPAPHTQLCRGHSSCRWPGMNNWGKGSSTTGALARWHTASPGRKSCQVIEWILYCSAIVAADRMLVIVGMAGAGIPQSSAHSTEQTNRQLLLLPQGFTQPSPSSCHLQSALSCGIPPTVRVSGGDASR